VAHVVGRARVAILDGLTGKRVRALTGTKDTVHHAAWTRSGRPVCACEDGRTVLWSRTGTRGVVLGEQPYVPGALCAAQGVVVTAGHRVLHVLVLP